MSMIDPHGSRLQESMRVSPHDKAIMGTPMLRGVIKPQGVRCRDNSQNKTKQTVVDISLLGGWPDIASVPVAAAKINNFSGEEYTPDPGDNVLVAFINGNFTDPVVIGYLPLPSNDIQATTAQGGQRYHQRISECDTVIDNDGNRTISIEVNDTLTVNGKRTTIIEGNESLTINSGDITIDVTAGKCTVNIKGKTAWKSDGTIELDGGSGAVKGVVTGDCICAYTGSPHPMRSATVKASI